MVNLLNSKFLWKEYWRNWSIEVIWCHVIEMNIDIIVKYNCILIIITSPLVLLKLLLIEHNTVIWKNLLYDHSKSRTHCKYDKTVLCIYNVFVILSDCITLLIFCYLLLFMTKKNCYDHYLWQFLLFIWQKKIFRYWNHHRAFVL
jgi:hypothetical protein